jgi:RNA polymerase sigma-70 factor (ECF subfamily)
VLVPELDTVLLEPVSPAKPVVAASDALADEVTAYFDQLRHPLLRYLLSFGLAPHDGEEVIQEVFLALFQHLRRGGARTNLRSWIFRVAHNLGLRRCNARRTEAKLFSGEEISEIPFDPAPNPEERWVRRERQRRLLAVVEALPEQDRRCLYLRAEGLRYREIVGVLGMSLGAVALSLSRTLARLSRADEG